MPRGADCVENRNNFCGSECVQWRVTELRLKREMRTETRKLVAEGHFLAGGTVLCKRWVRDASFD